MWDLPGMTCPRAGPWGPHGALASLAPEPARYTSDRPTDGRPEPAAPGKPRRVVGWRRDRVPPAPPSHERIDHPAWPGFGPGRAAEPVTASPHRPWTLCGVCRRKSAAPRTSPRGPVRVRGPLSVCGRSQTVASGRRVSFGSRRHSRAGPLGD